VFKTAASACLGYARVLRKIGTGGETRTHMIRLLRAARLPFAPLPLKSAGGGSRTHNGPIAHDDLSVARLPFTPHQLGNDLPKATPGEGLEPSLPVSKTSVLPLDDPGLTNPARLERAASGFASLRSNSAELRVQTREKNGGGATRTHTGKEARRLSTPLQYHLCDASETVGGRQ
jgi:hypothetical protein